MKIGHLYETNQIDAVNRVGARTGRELPVGKNGDGRETTLVDTDQVKLSEAARRANGVDESFDIVRVSALQKAIAEGRYPVDAGKIADALITQAAELLQTLTNPEAAEQKEE